MNRLLRMFCMGVLGLLLTSGAAAWAQATAELAGRVTDESGAVLPGVTVTATQTDTGFTRPSSPTARAPGSCRTCRPARTGWRWRSRDSAPTSRPASCCRSAPRRRSTRSSAVGNLEETVSVEAAAPIVDVRSAGISDVVENERIVELPLQGRQVTDLIVLAGRRRADRHRVEAAA